MGSRSVTCHRAEVRKKKQDTWHLITSWTRKAHNLLVAGSISGFDAAS